jgi:hypothetical protein
MNARSCSWLLLGFFLAPAANLALAGEKNGALAYPIRFDEIKKTLTEILSSGDNKADENTEALRRLQAYRYLAGVPYKDLVLDEKYNEMCLAGVKLCALLGKLEHTPKNPGLPEDEFKLAYSGTSRSNLGMGLMTLAAAVDAWMFDSAAGTMEQLGHRRWCLNPAMQKTGFARSGAFTAMYSFDQSRRMAPDFDLICYPARGYMPLEFFNPKSAWSVTLNPKKYRAPAKDFTPKIYRADTAGAKQGEPLDLDFHNVDTVPFGIPNCIIFRPRSLEIAPGGRYVVELEGIERIGAREPVSLNYVVEFVRWR